MPSNVRNFTISQSGEGFTSFNVNKRTNFCGDSPSNLKLSIINSNGTKQEHVVHTHRTSRRSSWPRGFGELNPSTHSWIFTSTSVDCSHRSYLFTSATVRQPVHITPICVTEPIRYVVLHFPDRRGAARRGAASLRHRNGAKITVLMCEQKPHSVWFSYLRKGIRYSVNIP